MKLKLYNTLSNSIEIFEPIDPKNVRMYVCGPTVYDRAHLGNARPAVVFDILYRILRVLYPKVTYVRNITDVDDKIYKRAIEKNISIKELTDETIRMYHEDMDELNVLPPDIEPKATDHIKDMINVIENLIQNKNAYISNNHVYFDVSSFKNYGSLSKKNMDELMSGARIEISDNKKNPLDFVLWKPIDDDFKIGWESPWGMGRPGWHIECSAMSLRYLGQFFDIHGGGIDLVFPHHENEIAQSCAIGNGKSMAKYWIHNGHLNINGVKMSKSLGNFFTVRDILDKFNGEVIRLTFLMTHFASPMNFSIESLNQSKNILDKWYRAILPSKIDTQSEIISNDVLECLLDNMNTPKAISIIHSLVDDINKSNDNDENERNYKSTILVNTARKLLGLMTIDPKEWFCDVDENLKNWIESKINERIVAKQNKDYENADKIRNELLSKGITIEDTKNGTTWKKV